MSREMIGRRQLDAIRADLTERDLTILGTINRLRLMSTHHVERLFFADHASNIAAARAVRRALERLTDRHVLQRLDRRVGGMRGGSRAHVYGVGPIGGRLLSGDGPRKRWHEPTATFVEHTLAIAEVVVRLHEAHRRGELELLAWQAEPQCWRTFMDGLAGTEVLRPDLFVSLGRGEYEYRSFVEIDLGTESSPTVVRKCQVYERYYRSGQEQQRHDVFPHVLWVVPDERRGHLLGRALRESMGEAVRLFDICLVDRTLGALLGEP